MATTDSPEAPPGAAPAPHAREAQRLAALRATGLLDSPPASRFDAITDLARHVFDVPIALISLVDSDRQWFLSRQGLEVAETPRDIAFCAYAIHEPQLLIVDDAREHPVLRGNPLVTGEPGIRFYAGAVLRSPEGLPFGTLCVIDTEPREMAPRDRDTLLSLARLAQSEMLLPAPLCAERSRAQIGTNRDPITGRLWGDAFFEQLDRRAAAATAPALVSVHVDGMGYFANMYGRLVADEIAIATCDRLARSLSAQSPPLLARLDSDWFAAAVTPPADVDPAAALERLRDALVSALGAPCATSIGRVRIRAAVGLAMSGGGNGSAEQTLRLARLAAAELSEPAEVRGVVVDDVIRTTAMRRQRLAAELADAFRDDALTLLFQPKIESATDRVSGLECLLRWQHPVLGLILPTEIVDIAGEAGLTRRLDRWVLSRAIRHLAEWSGRGLSFGRLSVNVTTTTLVAPDFDAWLARELAGNDVAASMLDLEIVESAVASDYEATVRVMQRLRDAGITFSLDDFGTGFSSLSILRELPVSTLKIDKSFVDRLSGDSRAASLCSGIVNLAHELGLNTVAEGVETADQSGILRALNCDQQQGFCFAEPLSAADVERRYGVTRRIDG